jgi:hypothetical protein
MGTLSAEWDWWAIVNGVPAFIGGVLFISAPWLRRAATGVGIRLPDGVGFFDQRFAWDIAARRDALLLGVGYVMRGLLFLHIYLATTWQDIRWILFGNVAFAAVLLVVTLVWGDHFHWRRFSAIGWLFLYIEEPIWMLTLVADATAGGVPLVGAGSGLGPILVVVLLAEAALSLAAAAWFFFRRPTAADRVSSRVLAGFWLGWTGWSIALVLASSWEEAQWGLALDILWIAGVGLVYLLRRDRPAGSSDAPSPASGLSHTEEGVRPP